MSTCHLGLLTSNLHAPSTPHPQQNPVPLTQAKTRKQEFKMAKYNHRYSCNLKIQDSSPQKHTIPLALYDPPSKNWHIITAYLFLYRHSTQILQAEPFKCVFSDLKAVRDETKMGAEFSRRALLSLLLSERLSIFNLSCVLPIGLRATRRRVIGRLALCVPHRLSLLPSLCSDTLLQCREGCCCHLPGKYSYSALKTTGVNKHRT